MNIVEAYPDRYVNINTLIKEAVVASRNTDDDDRTRGTGMFGNGRAYGASLGGSIGATISSGEMARGRGLSVASSMITASNLVSAHDELIATQSATTSNISVLTGRVEFLEAENRRLQSLKNSEDQIMSYRLIEMNNRLLEMDSRLRAAQNLINDLQRHIDIRR
jgi:hypothetical protein